MSSSISGIHSYHTGCETFNLTSRLTEVLVELDNSKSDPLLGGLGSRVVGVIVTPLTSLIDAIWHAIVFVVKIVTGAVVSPYNFFARLVHPKHALPENLELSSAFVHLKRSAEYLLNVVTLPILSAMSPGKAHGFVNHGFAEKQADTVIRNLNKEKTDLNTTVNDQKTKITELESNNTTLEKEKTQLENENNAMNTTAPRVSQLEQEILNLKNTNSQLENEKTALQGESDQQKTTIADLQKENKRLGVGKENIESEKDNFKGQVESLGFQITQKDYEIKNLGNQLTLKLEPLVKNIERVLALQPGEEIEMSVLGTDGIISSSNQGPIRKVFANLPPHITPGDAVLLSPTKRPNASILTPHKKNFDPNESTALDDSNEEIVPKNLFGEK